MRTAQEMYDFAVSNGFQYYDKLPNDLKTAFTQFQKIESSLHPEEEVLFAMVTSAVQDKGAYVTAGPTAVAFTDRVIICSGTLPAIFTRKDVMKRISLETVNDYHKTTGILQGEIVIDTLKETTRITCSNDRIDDTFKAIDELLQGIKKPKESVQVIQQTSAADEILKFKQLLDAGVITQEEFDAKKKQLLGI